MIDVVLAATRRRFGDLARRLTLGRDEQHLPATGDHVAHGLQGRVEHRHRLLQIENVNAVALTENVGAHARIPAARAMSEVNASFEQLAHCKGRDSHVLLRLCVHGVVTGSPGTGATETFPPRPRVRIYGRLDTLESAGLQGKTGKIGPFGHPGA